MAHCLTSHCSLACCKQHFCAHFGFIGAEKDENYTGWLCSLHRQQSHLCEPGRRVFTLLGVVEAEEAWFGREVGSQIGQVRVTGQSTQLTDFGFPVDGLMANRRLSLSLSTVCMRVSACLCFVSGIRCWIKTHTPPRARTISTAFLSPMLKAFMAASRSGLNLKGTTDIPAADAATAVWPCQMREKIIPINLFVYALVVTSSRSSNSFSVMTVSSASMLLPSTA